MFKWTYQAGFNLQVNMSLIKNEDRLKNLAWTADDRVLLSLRTRGLR